MGQLLLYCGDAWSGTAHRESVNFVVFLRKKEAEMLKKLWLPGSCAVLWAALLLCLAGVLLGRVLAAEAVEESEKRANILKEKYN